MLYNRTFIRARVAKQLQIQLRFNSTITSETLRENLTKRYLPTLYDYLSPTPSHLLDHAIASFLPKHEQPAKSLPSIQSSHGNKPAPLRAGRHLIYFPAPLLPDFLLEDGTDPSFAPGEPYTNRMWAGGKLAFAVASPLSSSTTTSEEHSQKADGRILRLDGSRAACVERIRDVAIKGAVGSEKAFVSVERAVGIVDEGEDDSSVRTRLSSEHKAEPPSLSWSVIETRNLVFMPESVARALTLSRKSSSSSPSTPKKPLPTLPKPLHSRTLPSHSLGGSTNLLFQFSALTYNAHRIHLDPEYAREREGHGDILFHGPLSLTLMCTLLENVAQDLTSSLKSNGQSSGDSRVQLSELEYRNVAPISRGQDVTVHCAPKQGQVGKEEEQAQGQDTSTSLGTWQVWVETEPGNICVIGRAKFAMAAPL